jgi:hypothetical protein
MSKLTDWLLSFPHVSDVREITATIKGKTYIGAHYCDSNFNNEPRLYLLGDLPACYRRTTKTAFVIDGADWYVACYMQSEPIPERFAAYHPCGKHFMLCQWKVTDGTPIDHYYLKPYDRVPTTLA